MTVLLIQRPVRAEPPLQQFFSRYLDGCNAALVYFGLTNQGNRLELDPCSLHHRNGKTYFTYSVEGHAIAAKTYCTRNEWIVRSTGEVVTANSVTARDLLRWVCQ